MNKEKIEVPYLKDLKDWRAERGLITPEWEAYAQASRFQTTILTALGFAIGILGVALGK